MINRSVAKGGVISEWFVPLVYLIFLVSVICGTAPIETTSVLFPSGEAIEVRFDPNTREIIYPGGSLTRTQAGVAYQQIAVSPRQGYLRFLRPADERATQIYNHLYPR